MSGTSHHIKQWLAPCALRPADGLALADDEAAGLFRCAQYGAVYQLGGRLNELMLRVKA